MDVQLPYDPFRGVESVTLRELLEEVFSDTIDYDYEGRDPFSGENALTANSMLYCDEDRPLHWVARRGNVKCLQLLLDAGADPHAMGDLSCTPLDEAVSHGHLEVAQLLLQAGARIDPVSELGYSALGLCSPNGYKPNSKMFGLLQSFWPGVVPHDMKSRKY